MRKHLEGSRTYASLVGGLPFICLKGDFAGRITEPVPVQFLFGI